MEKYIDTYLNSNLNIDEYLIDDLLTEKNDTIKSSRFISGVINQGDKNALINGE